MEYSKAKRRYRIRSAVVTYGTGIVVVLSVAIVLGLLLSVFGVGGSVGYRGGGFTLVILWFGLWCAVPILFVLMIIGMINGRADKWYFKERSRKKKLIAMKAGRTKYAARWV